MFILAYTSGIYGDDIALLKLNEAAPYNERVRPVCLPWNHKNTDFVGKVSSEYTISYTVEVIGNKMLYSNYLTNLKT